MRRRQERIKDSTHKEIGKEKPKRTFWKRGEKKREENSAGRAGRAEGNASFHF